MQIIDDNLDFTVDYNGFNFIKSQMTTKTQNISASQFFFILLFSWHTSLNFSIAR